MPWVQIISRMTGQPAGKVLRGFAADIGRGVPTWAHAMTSNKSLETLGMVANVFLCYVFFFYNLAFDANKCIKIMPSVCFNAHILLRLRVRLLCAPRKTWWVMWGCQLPLLPVDWSGLLLLQKGMKREVLMRNSRSTSWESLFLFLSCQTQKTRGGNHCKVYDLEIGPSSWHKEIAFIFFQASWVPMLNEKNQYGNPFGKNFASQMVNMKFLTWKGRVLSSWRTPMLWHFMGTKAVAAESRLFLFANFGQCLGEECGQPKKNRGKFQLHDGMSNRSSTT